MKELCINFPVKKPALYLLCIFAPYLLFGQLNFDNCYDLNGWDFPREIIINSKNQYVITGSSDGGMVFLIIDKLGNILIKKTIVADFPVGVDINEVTSANGESQYLITGYNYIYGEPGYNEAFIVHVDSIGNEIWRNQGGEPIFGSSIVLNDREVYFASSKSLKRIDLDRHLIYSYSFENYMKKNFHALDIDTYNDNIYVFGSDSRYKILKFNQSQQLVDTVNLNTDKISLSRFKVYDEENIVIGGGFWNFLKATFKEGIIWKRNYPLGNYDFGYLRDFLKMNDDGFLLVGSKAKIHPYGWCPIVIKVNDAGQGEWFQEVGICDTNSGLYSIVKDEEKLIVAGTKYCGDLDIFIHELDTLNSINYITSLHNLSINYEILVFPNPSCNEIMIDSDESFYYFIYNAMGRLEIHGHSFDNTINIEKLNNGLFYIYIRTNEGVIHRGKIVKNCG